MNKLLIAYIALAMLATICIFLSIEMFIKFNKYAGILCIIVYFCYCKTFIGYIYQEAFKQID